MNCTVVNSCSFRDAGGRKQQACQNILIYSKSGQWRERSGERDEVVLSEIEGRGGSFGGPWPVFLHNCNSEVRNLCSSGV